MTGFLMSRRAALAGLAGMALLPAAARAGDWRFRAIEVDVRPLRAGGDTITADWISRDLPALLRNRFAAHMAPNDPRAPVLRARIDQVRLGVDGSAGIEPGGPSAIDWIEGEGIVIGGGGRQVAHIPLQAAVHVKLISDPGQTLGQERIGNLAASFAQWLPGKMGL